MKVCLLPQEFEGPEEIIGLLSQWAGDELSSTGGKCFSALEKFETDDGQAVYGESS